LRSSGGRSRSSQQKHDALQKNAGGPRNNYPCEPDAYTVKYQHDGGTVDHEERVLPHLAQLGHLGHVGHVIQHHDLAVGNQRREPSAEDDRTTPMMALQVLHRVEMLVLVLQSNSRRHQRLLKGGAMWRQLQRLQRPDQISCRHAHNAAVCEEGVGINRLSSQGTQVMHHCRRSVAVRCQPGWRMKRPKQLPEQQCDRRRNTQEHLSHQMLMIPWDAQRCLRKAHPITCVYFYNGVQLQDRNVCDLDTDPTSTTLQDHNLVHQFIRREGLLCWCLFSCDNCAYHQQDIHGCLVLFTHVLLLVVHHMSAPVADGEPDDVVWAESHTAVKHTFHFSPIETGLHASNPRKPFPISMGSNH